MSDPTPEVPETPEDSWRALAIDQFALLRPDEDYPVAEWMIEVAGFAMRRDALLAAEDEHPATDQALIDQIVQATSPTLDTSNADVKEIARTAIRVLRPATPVDKHPPTFHVVMGTHLVYPDGRWPETEKHWHVRVVARNGKTLLSSENYTERRGAVDAAHLLADPLRAKVVVEET